LTVYKDNKQNDTKSKVYEQLIKALHAQEIYQKIGMLQKDSDHSPKIRWHAKGGYDLIQWLKSEIPELEEEMDKFTIRKYRVEL
jgi:hypothetical protein